MERYKVEVTNEARTDIRAAARYIAVQLRQPDTAERLLDTLDNEITSLETMPERCGYVHDEYLASLGIRMTMAHNYLIFYVVDRTVGIVTILRVLNGRRNWITILTEQYSKT